MRKSCETLWFGLIKPTRQNLLLIVIFLAASTALATQFTLSYWKGGPAPPQLNYQPRDITLDVSGYATVWTFIREWPATSSLQEVATSFGGTLDRVNNQIDQELSKPNLSRERHVFYLLCRAAILNYEGKPGMAGEVQSRARAEAEADPAIAEKWLYTIIYFQGVTALRRGENDNCIMCRGESSCILPILPAAVHANPTGSRSAIEYFTEYLDHFPDDIEVRWLLNLAHMTLGEYPHGVAPKHLLTLDGYLKSEFDIGRFRDVGHLVGVNRFNYSGGGIMDDFDNDGLLDIVISSNYVTEPMAFYRNLGNGKFEDRTKAAGLSEQLGGEFCGQVDYNNDGYLDVFVPHGSWIVPAVRPSLLRNNGKGVFTDVTDEAGLSTATNSMSACWADYDNDGFLDLFLPDRSQPNHLYRNLRNGAFEDVAKQAGVAGRDTMPKMWKSATWIDYDNDAYPDLFINNINGPSTLYHNDQNGTFSNVTTAMGIDGPRVGFSCWAWDYDNDGWQDIFSTCYEYPLVDIVRGLQGKPHQTQSNRLYRNLEGKGFQDVTKEAGLDLVFATMGSNFGDFDNDGFLDMYLGTGGPDLAILVPNRMFKNVGGKRFAEITATSGTGNLQKGHSVACGDWDRNGTLDIFIEMGGVTVGDRYHNILFQNPGQGNHWLNLKLVGAKSNKSAIGARIKVVTAGKSPLTIYRHVSTGSSFGANPHELMIGLGQAERIKTLEIFWPTSGETQVFHDIAADKYLRITEFESHYEELKFKPITLPKE